jgi:hypothetical protein
MSWIVIGVFSPGLLLVTLRLLPFQLRINTSA